jgi:WD40 repeat protein
VNVAWAPGGRRLAYTAAIEGDVHVVCHPDQREVTGTWVTPLIRPVPRQVSPFIDEFGGLSWSPDGRRILVIPGFGSGEQPAGSLRDTGGLVGIDAAGGGSTVLIRGRTSSDVFHAQFAPRTGTIGYSLGPAFGPGESRIWAAGTQGRRRHQLAKVSGAVTALSWSPDGHSLAIVTDSSSARKAGARSLWLIGAVSHKLRLLAVNKDGPVMSPSWSPDSTHLAYIGGPYACRCGFGNTPLDGTTVYSVSAATGQYQVVLGRQSSGGVLQPVRFTGLAWSR